MEVVAQRVFDPLYMWLDIGFLLIFAGMLLYKKKYATVVVGIIFGFVYQLVDYGIFHLLTHSRSISDGHSLFWVLMWMSMSYGFTNFVWIWLWISKDKNLFEWTLLILGWWVCCPLITKTFGTGENMITIQRTTGSYHGYMAIILFVGYLLLILWNISRKKKEERINIPWLLIIGILVQFGWEAGLFLGGIRSAELGSAAEKLAPMIINSLLETNLGMPYIFAIFIAFSAKFKENLKKRTNKLTFFERIIENNSEKVKNTETSEYLDI